MAFREKMAWISVLTIGLVFGGYFWNVASAWNQSWLGPMSFGLLIGAVATLIIITVVLAIITAIMSPSEAEAPADEREELIALKAERIASYVLSICVVLLIWALLNQWNGVVVANLLLASLVISELVKSGAQIAYYRAGA
jgi:hypothetical protein